MGNLFDLDSPVFQALNRIADLLVINVLVILCSVPVVTIGAAQTALYYALGRQIRQEGRVWKDYWHAFCSNFKQATILWLIFLTTGAMGFGIILFHLSAQSHGSAIALCVASAFSFLWLGALVWVFPLQSRFENTVLNTLRNALQCAVFCLPRTLVMLAISTMPLILFVTSPNLFALFSPLLLIVWFSLVANIKIFLMKKVLSATET